MQVQSVETKLMKALIRRLHKRRFGGFFEGCTSIELTILQAFNRWLDKRRIDDCTSGDSPATIVESSVLVIIFKIVVRVLSSKMSPHCYGFSQKYI